MKTKLEATRRIASVIAIAIITLALVGLSSTGCDNGNNTPSHVHEWGDWVVTTPPTTTAEGVETRTCATCGEKETRPIAKLPEQPKDQTATITLFEGKTATVKGNFTDAEWDGVADKIKTAINGRFVSRIDVVKDVWRTTFSRGVTIIVEASPAGYTNWKTIGDGKTIYLSLAATDTADLDVILGTAIGIVSNNQSMTDGVTQQPHDQTATITLFEGKTATVKGNFTDAEWGSGATGIAGKIEAAINAIFDLIPSEDATKDKWRTAFSRSVIIIVEKSPTGYTNWKTIGDGKTIYFSLAATNSANIGNLIAPAITSLSNNGSGYVKAIDNSRNAVRIAAIKPKHDRVHAG